MSAEAAQDFAAARDKLNRKRKAETAIKEVVQALPALPVTLRSPVLRSLGPLGSVIVQAMKDCFNQNDFSSKAGKSKQDVETYGIYTFICPKLQNMLIDPTWTGSHARNTEDTLAAVKIDQKELQGISFVSHICFDETSSHLAVSHPYEERNASVDRYDCKKGREVQDIWLQAPH